MSMRYKGGVISATPPTTSSSSAVGVWTLEQQLQATAGSGWPVPPVYWIGMLNGATTYIRGVTVDTANNTYMVGVNTSASGMEITKYNFFGTIQWQRSLAGISGGYSVVTDSSNNVYVTGQGGGQTFCKYNSSGVLQFQKQLNSSAGVGNGIAIDSASNLYICGKSDDGLGSNAIRITKYDSAGTLIWQRKLDNASATSEFGSGVVCDSSNNVYIVGESTASGTIKAQVAKYNSSGVIQWQRETNSGTDQNNGYGIAIDSAANIYVASALYISGSSGIGLTKYNTSGTLQWARRLDFGGSAVEGFSATVDNDGFIYVCGYAPQSGNQDWVWAKYDSSGTLQWQRYLSTTSTSEQAKSINASIANSLVIGGWTSIVNPLSFLFAKVPQDGSKTGTYVVNGKSFIYGNSGLTATSPSLTNSASSLTDAATTSTETTTTFTDATTSLTSSVTTL